MEPNVIDSLWAVIQVAMARASEDPVGAVESIVTTYLARVD